MIFREQRRTGILGCRCWSMNDLYSVLNSRVVNKRYYIYRESLWNRLVRHVHNKKLRSFNNKMYCLPQLYSQLPVDWFNGVGLLLFKSFTFIRLSTLRKGVVLGQVSWSASKQQTRLPPIPPHVKLPNEWELEGEIPVTGREIRNLMIL